MISWDVPVVRWVRWLGIGEVELGFIEPLLRRRLSPMARGALHVANACAQDYPSASFVFASRHGELTRTVELLRSLAHEEELSPTLFSLSVLNAAAGIFSIARGDRAPATAIAAGLESFGYGLLEAYLRARQEPARPVVYVYADAPAPNPMGPQFGDPEAVFALGLLIHGDARSRLHTGIRTGSEAGIPATLQAYACLEALERGSADWASDRHHWYWNLQ